MSIWGKILGGAAGFAIGGPIGALIGVLGGHAVDKYAGSEARRLTADDPDARPVAFTIACIALGAKMAKADGVVTREEIEAFKQVFRVPPEESKNVARVFDIAKRDARGFEPYARQVAKMFRDNPAVLEELMGALFHIAAADGVYHPGEKEYLATVARNLGFGEADFRRIEAQHMGPDEADPYVVLGVDHEATDAEVKAAWRKLIKEHHPDRMVADGMPEELVSQANDHLATINGAWEKIRAERGI